MQVRDGKKQVPICPECGCRLKEIVGRYTHFGEFDEKWRTGRDAAGCLCKFVKCDFAKFSNGWHYIESTGTLHWKPV